MSYLATCSKCQSLGYPQCVCTKGAGARAVCSGPAGQRTHQPRAGVSL